MTSLRRLFANLFEQTPIGWLQLRGNKGRLLVALGGIAFADLLMFMQLGVLGAALDSSALFNKMLNTDIVLISPEARDIQNSATIPRARLYQAEGSQVSRVARRCTSPLWIGVHLSTRNAAP